VTSKLTLKRWAGKVWRLGRHARARQAVLLYHSIGDTPAAVTETKFRTQMEWLAEQRAFTSTEAIADAKNTETISVAISFDDGYASIFDTALPILRKIGATATVFLNTGWIGTHERMRSDEQLGHYPAESFLVWDEVAALRDAGWAIGSHGVDHLDLTTTDDLTTRDQLHRAKETIQRLVGGECDAFAYTWGRHSDLLRGEVAKAGYRRAYAGVHAPLSRSDDPMAIPRINIARDYTLEDFKAIIAGDWDYLGWVQRLRSRLA